jgi:hypothetical protein
MARYQPAPKWMIEGQGYLLQAGQGHREHQQRWKYLFTQRAAHPQ